MPCLTERRPTIDNAAELIFKPGEDFCPIEATGGCLLAEAAVAIGEQLRYARRADKKCGPKPDEEPNP